MKNISKFATVAILVTSLAPFAAQARSGDIGTTYPAHHLVHIANAPSAKAEHGRLAANAQVPATLTTEAGADQYANFANDNGFAG